MVALEMLEKVARGDLEQLRSELVTCMMTGQLSGARTGPGLPCHPVLFPLCPSPGRGIVISHTFSALSYLRMTSLVSS